MAGFNITINTGVILKTGTCIIVLKHNGKVYMAGDRQVTSDDYKIKTKIPKIVKRKGLLLGCMGDIAALQVIHYTLSIPARSSYNSNDAYVLCGVAREFNKALNTWNVGEVPVDGHLLIGYRGEIYQIQPDGGGFQIDQDYYAMGGGSDMAMGILKMNTKLDPEDRLKKAMADVTDISCSVGFGVDIIKE